MSDEKNKVGSEDTVDIEIDDETSAGGCPHKKSAGG